MTTIPQDTPKRQPRTEPIFYVYFFYRGESTVPFYIGKGCKKRINGHETCARNHPHCKHQVCRILRKEWREGRQIRKEKIADGIPERAAFNLERFFISMGAIYQWPLVNKTIGGEGTSGFKITRTPEQREQNRQRSLQRFSIPGEREKLRQRAIERFSDVEEREKQRQRVLKRFSDPEEVEKQRQRTIQRYANGVEISDEEREKRRQRAVRDWSNPEIRARRVQKDIERFSDPEEVERSRQRTKELWQAPEYREKMLKLRQDPALRARQSKARSEAAPNRVGTFEGFIDPQGVIYSPVVNLTAFCQENNLSYCGMWLVAKGKQVSHKGWIRYSPYVE